MVEADGPIQETPMVNKAVARARASAERVAPAKSIEDVAAYERIMAALLGEIDEHTRGIEREVKEQLAALADAVAPRHRQIVSLAKAIATYADAHRDALVEPGSKTATLPTGGLLRWYTTGPAVKLEGRSDDIVARLEALGQAQFIRIKKEVDREALLKNPEAATSIEGVSIERSEKFVILPSGRDERIEQNVDTNRWKIVRKEETELAPPTKAK